MMRTDIIPSEADWHSEPWCIDTPYAYKNFFGKTISEAIDLFEENALRYEEDIMFMPLVCFRYYVHAYMDYLLSDRSKGDSDGASAFFGLVEVRNTDIRESGRDLQNRIVEMLEYLGRRQDWYEADRDIYGEFSARASKAMKTIQ